MMHDDRMHDSDYDSNNVHIQGHGHHNHIFLVWKFELHHIETLFFNENTIIGPDL